MVFYYHGMDYYDQSQESYFILFNTYNTVIITKTGEQQLSLRAQ